MDHKNEYAKYAFLVMDPCGNTIHEILRIKNNDERLKKIDEIRKKGHYLYYSQILYDKSEKVLKIQRPFIVDFDSVPEPDNSTAVKNALHKCKDCGKSFTTTFGLAHHRNVKHKQLGKPEDNN